MVTEVLTKEEVRQIEDEVDSNFESTALPTKDLNTARWIVCATGDDTLRLGLGEVAKVWNQIGRRQDRARFIAVLDSHKYSLRYGLDLCSRRLEDTGAVGPIPTDEYKYTTSIKLLSAAREFSDATRAFSSFHAGFVSLSIDRLTGTIETSWSDTDYRYASLEILLGTDRDEFSVIAHLVTLFCGPEFDMPAIDSVGSWGPVIHSIVNKARVKRGRIHYQIITSLAQDLLNDYGDLPTYPSPTWKFPWGDMADSGLYYATLQVICTYHLLTVHFGAEKFKLSGGGIDQICKSISIAQLNSDIARVSSLSVGVVEKITGSLIYGNKTKTPDPALQPLIPIGNGSVALPVFVILSSDWARNMLSLHARISASSFDANSSNFEGQMIASIVTTVPSRYSVFPTVHVPTAHGREELDLVLVDSSAHSILIVELRWMLQPGDVREVLNRKKVIKEKVTQCQRKVVGIEAEPSGLIKALAVAPAPDWSINGIVVIEGFGGSLSELPKGIPVVPRDVFMRTLKIAPSLDHVHAVLATPLWLPEEGADFDTQVNQKTICGIPFNHKGFGVGSRSYMLESLDGYLNAAISKGLDQLKAITW